MHVGSAYGDIQSVSKWLNWGKSFQMIHPDSRLEFINDQIGYGVIATDFIPKGTLTFVKDPFDVDLTLDAYLSLEPQYKTIADKYSYREGNGHRILSWDIAKYMNHSCFPNTISTGYGFEIAVRDIHAGEEMTDDYGIFNLEQTMQCYCGEKICRGIVSSEDFIKCYENWDVIIKKVLPCFNKVMQPLMKYLDSETHSDLLKYLNTGHDYQSILTQRLVDNSYSSTNRARSE